MVTRAINPDEKHSVITMNADFEEIRDTLQDMAEQEIGSDKDLIYNLNNLHATQQAAAWVVGKMLDAKQTQLDEDFEDWKRRIKDPTIKYSDFKSVFIWIEAQKESGKLTFGRRTGNRYIQLYRETSFEIGSKLGTKKNELIRKIPDESKREKIRELAAEEAWTTEKIKSIVKASERETRRKEVFEHEIKPHLPLLSIKLNVRNKEQLIIETDNPIDRDILNEILQEKYIDRLKEEIYRRKIIIE